MLSLPFTYQPIHPFTPPVRYHSSIVERLKALGIALCLALFVWGCDSGNKEIAPPEPMPHDHPDMAGGTNGANPFSSTGTTGTEAPPMGEPTKPADLKPIKDAEASYDKTKKAYEAAKTDEKAKKDYIAATQALADAHMFGDEPARVKYKAALKYYREVLKVDPANQIAKKSADTIIGIYEEMGRPVPEEGG